MISVMLKENLEGRMKCVKCLEETNFLFQSERDSTCAYTLLSIYTTSTCKQLLWKASDLSHGVCFLIS